MNDRLPGVAGNRGRCVTDHGDLLPGVSKRKRCGEGLVADARLGAARLGFSDGNRMVVNKSFLF